MQSSETPDYTLIGTVSGDQFSLSGIRCEVFLSEVVGEVGSAVFKLPDNSIIKELGWASEFSFNGNQMMVGGESVAKFIQLSKLYRKESGTRHWGTDVAEAYLRATIQEMTIGTPLPNSGMDKKKITGRFLLSPNSVLTPFQWLTPSYTGEIVMEKQTKCFSVILADGMSVRFDTYYKHKTGDQQETILAPYLIAEFEVTDADESFCPTYQEIDDFMLIASFVAQQRSMCVGWEIETASGLKEHRRRVVLSEAIDEKHEADALIFGRSEAEAFLTKAYGIFNLSNHPTLLREAVGGILGNESYLLSEYLTLYSSLETLLLIFRKDHRLEFIIDDYNALYKEIKNTIRHKLPGDENKQQRALLYQNLTGLNYISFSEAFKAFKEFHNLNLSDLWPITGKKGSLSDIRNRLVHGNKFEDDEFTAVMDATYHLRLLLERCLLLYLGYDHDQAVRATSLLDGGVAERCKESFQKLKRSEGSRC